MKLRRKQTSETRATIEGFLLKHGGDRVLRPGMQHGRQCEQHPPVNRMTHVELAAALKEETGLEVSRPWLRSLCDALEIPRRQKRGPHPLPDTVKKAQAKERFKRWYEQLGEDPERKAEYLRDKAAQRRDRTAVAV